MAHSDNSLDAIKHSWSVFADVTGGIDHPGQHHHCFNKDAHKHEDATGSLSVSASEDGTILWKCYGCGKAGTVVDALSAVKNIAAAEAIRELLRTYRAGAKETQMPEHSTPSHGHPMPTLVAEPIAPTPDGPRLERFITAAHANLMNRPEVRDVWLTRRGISVEVAGAHRLGFVERATFPQWPRWAITNAWVIPVSDAAGNVLAAKLHRENPPPKSPKCLWAPFGTRPDPGRQKPRHGWSTLWPWLLPPYEWSERAAIAEYDGALPREDAEALADRDALEDPESPYSWLYLCPGELKALAVQSSGLSATAITAGEEVHKWTAGLLAPFRGRLVFVLYDDDAAGHAFRDATIAALHGVARAVRAGTFGRKLG